MGVNAAVGFNSFSFDSDNGPTCIVGTLTAGESSVSDHGQPAYHYTNLTGLIELSIFHEITN